MVLENLKDVFIRAAKDPQWESEQISKRPLRGPQAEIIQKVTEHVTRKKGGVMTIRSSRQTGKNETSAYLHKMHLYRNQFAETSRVWMRTAPTHEPQITNSKKRLEELLKLDNKNNIHHPLFLGQKLKKTEGYIWKLGNASVEFLSSGQTSNVVGGTASEALDMDEAHKISKEKFDEDFMPMTASTNAATLLWGVAADGMDTIEQYRQLNEENGRKDLNLTFDCDIWREALPTYRSHVQDRIDALGWDHPIIKTQYRLIPVQQEGTFINAVQALSLFKSEHDRELCPTPGATYEMLIDVAAGNEDFNPQNNMVGEEETATDSTIVWVYKVLPILCSNGIFPVVQIVNIYWWTGVSLPKQEEEITDLIQVWGVQKVAIDGIGVGRHLAESLEAKFSNHVVKKYIASSTTISEDCYDLLARFNYSAVQMFRNDGSTEYQEFTRQVGWTKYSSSNGRMALVKPNSKKHIDMVKALTYINQNKPDIFIHQILSVESEY